MPKYSIDAECLERQRRQAVINQILNSDDDDDGDNTNDILFYEV